MIEACAALAEAGGGSFHIGGFGDESWHLDVADDLSAFVEQLPELLAGIREGREVEIDLLMAELGRAGVTVILKVDDERMATGGKPWTLVMSGPGLGEEGFIRAEAAGLRECLEQGLTRLRSRPGNWEWLSEVF